MPEKLQQREVEARLIIQHGHLDARKCATPLQLYRKQDQWGVVDLRVMFGLLPAEESNRKKQSVGSAFLEVQLCLSIKLDQRGVELRFFHSRRNFRSRHGLPCKLLFKILTITRLVDAAVATSDFQIRQRDDSNFAIVCQNVFQLGGIRANQLDCLGTVRQMEQAIPGGKVEQLALPNLELPRRGRRGCLHLDIKAGELRCSFQRFATCWTSFYCCGGGGRAVECKRAELVHASPAQVNSQNKLFVGQLPFCRIDSRTEGRRRRLCGESGFKKQKILQIHALAHSRSNVYDDL